MDWLILGEEQGSLQKTKGQILHAVVSLPRCLRAFSQTESGICKWPCQSACCLHALRSCWRISHEVTAIDFCYFLWHSWIQLTQELNTASKYHCLSNSHNDSLISCIFSPNQLLRASIASLKKIKAIFDSDFNGPPVNFSSWHAWLWKASPTLTLVFTTWLSWPVGILARMTQAHG